MFELTYKDCYHVERTLKYEDHEALMLTLSGCVTLPDTLYVTSLTFRGKKVYQGAGRRPLPFSISCRFFTSKLRFFLVFSYFC
ncbi:Uncharacterised protein [Streptococcus pneumoniae]|nr:Uncharacterised protein [Streptococcus pneumoniae]CWH87182.1 Uncharacterised protein [Streptococcus pneumoniae]